MNLKKKQLSLKQMTNSLEETLNHQQLVKDQMNSTQTVKGKLIVQEFSRIRKTQNNLLQYHQKWNQIYPIEWFCLLKLQVDKEDIYQKHDFIKTGWLFATASNL
ncbi:unnamed protein product [Paramecium octaurelia]|uniref:Uncharacterized protein n=1 Tax=Paramecium octaurelia TaxID=43137 RepID=A0A8S1YHB5_PAROT|nr:unnamed protein product [Paramecium octaurelia]